MESWVDGWDENMLRVAEKYTISVVRVNIYLRVWDKSVVEGAGKALQIFKLRGSAGYQSVCDYGLHELVTDLGLSRTASRACRPPQTIPGKQFGAVGNGIEEYSGVTASFPKGKAKRFGNSVASFVLSVTDGMNYAGYWEA